MHGLRPLVRQNGSWVQREAIPFATNDSDETFTIRIELRGERITIYVNDWLIHTWVDTTYSSGTISFFEATANVQCSTMYG